MSGACWEGGLLPVLVNNVPSGAYRARLLGAVVGVFFKAIQTLVKRWVEAEVSDTMHGQRLKLGQTLNAPRTPSM